MRPPLRVLVRETHVGTSALGFPSREARLPVRQNLKLRHYLAFGAAAHRYEGFTFKFRPDFPIDEL
jgi:hypothetical protein